MRKSLKIPITIVLSSQRSHFNAAAAYQAYTNALNCFRSILDHSTNRVVLLQQLIGSPTCLALHPLGMMLAVGFGEKLVFMCILA